MHEWIDRYMVGCADDRCTSFQSMTECMLAWTQIERRTAKQTGGHANSRTLDWLNTQERIAENHLRESSQHHWVLTGVWDLSSRHLSRKASVLSTDLLALLDAAGNVEGRVSQRTSNISGCVVFTKNMNWSAEIYNGQNMSTTTSCKNQSEVAISYLSMAFEGNWKTMMKSESIVLDVT